MPRLHRAALPAQAAALDVYHLLHPGPSLQRLLDADEDLLARVFAGLREAEDDLESAGRTYAGGLTKVEPRELEAVVLPGWLCATLSDRPAKSG